MPKSKIFDAIQEFEDSIPSAKIESAVVNLLAIAFAWDFGNLPIEDEVSRNSTTGALTYISLKLLKEVQQDLYKLSPLLSSLNVYVDFIHELSTLITAIDSVDELNVGEKFYYSLYYGFHQFAESLSKSLIDFLCSDELKGLEG